jgi:hypothetical protein
MTCTGNGDEVCGAAGQINIFTNGDTAPAILAATGDFQSQGCYSDSASARTLTTRVSLPGNVRVSDCTSACEAQGFQYAGLEFGQECYCGASIQNGGAPIADKLCDMACTADKTEYCGGRGAINIYKSSQVSQGPSTIPSDWTSQNCYTDSPSSRILSYKVPNFNSFSNAQCISECDSLGYVSHSPILMQTPHTDKFPDLRRLRIRLGMLLRQRYLKRQHARLLGVRHGLQRPESRHVRRRRPHHALREGLLAHSRLLRRLRPLPHLH